MSQGKGGGEGRADRKEEGRKKRQSTWGRTERENMERDFLIERSIVGLARNLEKSQESTG